MAFATYWIHVFSPINRKLKNGIHLVEAEEWKKGWWRVRIPNATRSTYVSPRVWGANRSIPYTGQPFGLAMQELHRLEKKDGKPNEPVQGPAGPVCAVGGSEVGESEAALERASFTRPDRDVRQRAVRRVGRRKAPRKA